jgi:hypothetical protein
VTSNVGAGRRIGIGDDAGTRGEGWAGATAIGPDDENGGGGTTTAGACGCAAEGA